MCTVVTGKNVKTYGDVKNLINSVIFRQEKEYPYHKIFDTVKSNLDDDSYAIGNNELKSLIDYKMSVFISTGTVKVNNGICTTVHPWMNNLRHK